MAIKKSQLYSTLWESCNALRGAMDASQYKDYVLIVLFVKYLSAKAKQHETDINLPEGSFFEDFVALKQNSHIGELMNVKLEAIKEHNAKILGGLVLPNFNDETKFGKGKEMIDTLSKLIGVFENDALDFSKNHAADDDLLGDAYEYLMKNFAAESGKSKGQFYTPAEVSRVIAKVLHLDESMRASDTIYDMTCGSGSLLLRANDETKRGRASLYGQEKDSSTASLAKLNMLLHGISTAEIVVGDTLNNPLHKEAGQLKTFNFCVANPPFSTKGWLTGNANDPYGRWQESALPPAKNGDYAFLLHLIASMKPEIGRGACILPHGVLFRGNAEEVIRTKLIKQRVIEGIIGLPANVFFGTGIPASIIILNNRRDTNGIFFIDASKDFLKDGNKNRLREQDIRKIVDTYRNRLHLPHYSRFVPFAEIEKNGYNLNIPRYIEAENTEETQNLDGHLNGGISDEEIANLSHWEAFAGLQDKLFQPFRPGFRALAIPADEVFSTVLAFPSVQSSRQDVLDIFSQWRQNAREKLLKLDMTAKKIVETLAFAMRDAYAESPVLDKYDAFGIFMDYALETLQDDLYVICADGWQAGQEIEVLKKNKRGLMTEWEGALLPKSILETHFFPAEVKKVAGLTAKSEEATSAFERFVEECADTEDDPLSEIRDDDKFVSDAEIKKTLKVLVNQPDRTAEIQAIRQYVALKEATKQANKILKETIKVLDEKALKQYPKLSEDEIKTLLIEAKWMLAVEDRLHSHFENVIQTFASSVIALHNRYQDTLSKLEADVAQSQAAVHAVLKEMGFVWKENEQ
jgi:type I restriction enzyme M protein